MRRAKNDLMLGRALGLVLLLGIGICSGCMHMGGVSLLDDFSRSPDAQRLMNEAVDRFLDKANLEGLENKSVRIRAGEYRSHVEAGFMGPIHIDVPAQVTEELRGVGWSRYLRAGLERKLSSSNAKCVEANPDLQLVVTKNCAGLQRRVFHLPLLPLFVIDLYQHRTYWAVFDATIDLKKGDGSRVLKTQRVHTKSQRIHRPRVFATSHVF